MNGKKGVLAGQELEIMKVIWQLEQATVRDVYEELLKHRKIAYTTVMTMMKILEQKGYLKKSDKDRAYLYRPARPQRQVINGMVKEFINRVFNGSAEPLLLHLVEKKGLSAEEISEIRRLINKEDK